MTIETLVIDVKKGRGWIYGRTQGVNQPTDRLIAPAFEPTEDYESPEFAQAAGHDLEQMTFQPSQHGTILRLFFQGEKWHLVTNTTLNAFNVNWSETASFGKLFTQALSETDPLNAYTNLTEGLDKSRVYYYLLESSGKNRIEPPFDVNKAKPHLVATLKQGSELYTIPDSPDLTKYTNWDEVYTAYEATNTVRGCQGLIFFDHSQNKFFKILNRHYYTLATVRGNVCNLLHRYWQVRNDEKLYNDIRRLYKLSVDDFDNFENDLFQAVLKVKDMYEGRFLPREGRPRKLYPQEFGWIMIPLSKAMRSPSIDNLMQYVNNLSWFEVCKLLKQAMRAPPPQPKIPPVKSILSRPVPTQQ